MRAFGRVAILLVLSGCALTNKAEPFEVRAFSPELAEASAKAAPATQAPGAELRLGRPRSSANLRRHIVYRVSDVEVGEYPSWQWTENPEEYLRRAVASALYDDRGLVQAVGGGHPVLDLELTAFEEVRRGAARLGRVRVSFVLRDDQHVLDSGEVTVEKPASSGEIDAVVLAISDALRDATDQVGDRVAAKLVKPATP